MKALIYLEESKLLPKGGPYAVGYYISRELTKRGVDTIDFIKDDCNTEHQFKNINSAFAKSLQKIVRIIRRYKRFHKIFNGGGYAKVDLNKYDVVHFHKTIDMLECKKSLDNYKGIVVLTSHSPVPLSKEFYDEYLLPFERKYLKSFYKQLIKIDEYAFLRADYIHFPCEEAEEPYLNNWIDYRKIKENKKHQYKYIPTGIPSVKEKRTRLEVRNELNIPNNDFCISYVGRHNIVKGYDNLKIIGRKLLKSQNVWVVVAGREEPLKRLPHDHWIEIGWTNDAHSYISQSDVFVLPNKETYFDIVMLEVLSLGKIVVASRTGGNRFFEKFKNTGIFLYNTVEEAVDIIQKIKSLTPRERDNLGMLNRQLYENNFTDVVFVDRYYNFINELVK